MPSELQLNFTEPLVEMQISRVQNWRGVSAEYVRMDGGSEYEFEWNSDSHYMALHDLVLSDGEMTVEGMAPIRGRDLRRKISYVPSGRPLKGWANSKDRVNQFVVVCFDPKILSEEVGRLYEAADIEPNIYFQDPHLERTLLRLQDILSLRSRYDSLFAEALGLTAALEILQLQGVGPITSRSQPGGLSHQQMRLVTEYIDDQLSAELSLDVLATIAGLSRFHFSRAFKVSFGSPPHQYVRSRRVEAAKTLLATTNFDMPTIAVAVGLKTSTQLIRAFQQITGTTPRKFRRAI